MTEQPLHTFTRRCLDGTALSRIELEGSVDRGRLRGMINAEVDGPMQSSKRSGLGRSR